MILLLQVSVSWEHKREPLFARLLQIYPEGFQLSHRGFFGQFSLSDQPTLRLLEILRNHGLRPRLPGSGAKRDNECLLRIYRVLDPADCEACELLELHPHVAHEYGTRKNNRYCIHTSRWYRHADFSRSDGSSVVVSDRVRRLLDASDLRGFRFDSTTIEDDTDRPIIDLSWDEIGEPWWELIPEHILPPMAPWMPFMDVHGNPIRADHPAAYHVRPALMSTPCHYRRSDLALPPEFDVYGTHERFFRPVEHERVPIVSQRFYRFCVENNLKCAFQPVRLDPDSGPTEPIPPYPPELAECLTPPAG